MSNSYKYVDSNFTYIDPQSGILKNLVDIKDAADLMFFESVAVAKRLSEIHKKPIKISGVESLFAIHKHLFQDVYAWAGEERTVEINKEGKQFFPTNSFEKAYRYIDILISDFKKIDKKDRIQIAEALAKLLDNINYLHPFRDGNGRTQREFIRILALEKEILLNLNPPDNKEVYDKYMQGTVTGDIKVLKDLISEVMN